ncbi:FepA family TonB-dependent siderophore receptor [Celerinatantimonas sp. MCCC 1A17872]
MMASGLRSRRLLTVGTGICLSLGSSMAFAATSNSTTATQDPLLKTPNAQTTQQNHSDKDKSSETKASEVEPNITVTASKMLDQQPGASIITKKEIDKLPPVNDLKDLIRRMPGVNLTGNGNTGSRGNNRQIDIRGMGPENTLILIDGVPVKSRDSVRYDRTGERDTRGDTNWVPASEVARIEVLRGPAAAIYGSGAMGGVVNIITKRPTKKWHGSFSLYTNQPRSSKEGATKRANFDLSGPLSSDVLTMRLYGNVNKTDADSPNINSSVNSSNDEAGMEGVRNKDINALLSWKMSERQTTNFKYGFSRQGNIYAGDTALSLASDATESLVNAGAETNRMYRSSYVITHTGYWSWGNTDSSLSYSATRNSRMDEGLTGKVDGQITSAESFSTSHLRNYRGASKADIPLDFIFPQTLTVGFDWNHDTLNDPFSTGQSASFDYDGVDYDENSSPKSQDTLFGIYAANSIKLTQSTTLVPAVRLDHHNEFGYNWSPSLNLSQQLGAMFTLKAGIARTFKAPNLYQLNPNYLELSSGNGCPTSQASGGCYLIGNADLKPERSINSEIGIEFKNAGYVAGITYFHNDYQNKIVSGTDLVGTVAVDGWYSSTYNVYQWQNTGKALVRGLEANLSVPLHRDLKFSTNATYMIENKIYSTGNPISIIPKYTLNSMLDWQASDKLDMNLNYTFYGRRKPRTNATIRNDSYGMDTTALGSYGLLGMGANYHLTKHISLGAGMSNIFDKVILRSGNGGNTFNQHGRAYYAKLTASF